MARKNVYWANAHVNKNRLERESMPSAIKRRTIRAAGSERVDDGGEQTLWADISCTCRSWLNGKKTSLQHADVIAPTLVSQIAGRPQLCF